MCTVHERYRDVVTLPRDRDDVTEFVSTLKDFIEKVRSQKPVEKVKIAQDVDDLFDVGGDEEETSSSSGNDIMGAAARACEFSIVCGVFESVVTGEKH